MAQLARMASSTPQPTPQPTIPGGTGAEDLAAQLGGGVAPATGPQVWLGQWTQATNLPGMPTIKPGGGKLAQPGLNLGVQVPVMVTKDQAVAQYYAMSPADKQSLISAAMKFGAKPEQINDAALASLWERYVISAQGYQSAGKMLTPWQVMWIDITTQEKAKQDSAIAKEPTTTTATNTNLSTKLDAQGILYTASHSLLGRDPTAEEANKFWTTLNDAERKSPSTTTTTTQYGPEGDAVSQQQTTSGGVSSDNKQFMAVEEAKKNPEYGAYQAATTYMDALRDLIYGKGY